MFYYLKKICKQFDTDDLSLPQNKTIILFISSHVNKIILLIIFKQLFQFNTNDMLPPQNTPTSPQSNNNDLFGNDAFGSTVSYFICV